MSISLRRRSFAVLAAAATVAALGACGSKTGSDSTSAGAAAVDTSGPTVKVGLLNSLSGTMAISEVTVRDSLRLAIDEINASGGVLGKQLAPVSRGRRVRLADLRREGAEADQPGQGRRGVRLLDLGQPQSGQAGLREE